MSPPIRILFLTANPSDTAALQLDEEIRLISQRIRRGEYRKLFEIRSAPAIRATDLPYELMDQTPDIVHFSGHGTKAGELCFVSDVDHETMPIPAQTLARVFKQFRDRVKCVVLNACYSSIQAAAIAESIPYVVGMSRAVPDSTAIAFAAGFYEAIAFGKTISEAFELGQTQVELTAPHLIASADIPQLIWRSGEDPSKHRLIQLAQPKESEFTLPSSAAAGTQTPTQNQRIKNIRVGGVKNDLVIGQYGNATGNKSQEVDDVSSDGEGNRLVVEQKDS